MSERVYNEYKRITKELRDVSDEIADKIEGKQKSIMRKVKFYLKTIIKADIKGLKKYSVNFYQVFPKPVNEIFRRDNVADMRNNVVYIGKEIRKDNINNQVEYVFYTIMIWHYIFKDLTFPILFIVEKEDVLEYFTDMGIEPEDIGYEMLGFDKTDLNQVKLASSLVKLDARKFLKNEFVDDEELEILRDYVAILAKRHRKMSGVSFY